MCEMLNLFVPAKHPALGEPVRGLVFDDGGEIQRDFAARFAAEGGTILSASGGKGCLCGFDDWDAAYETSRRALEESWTGEVRGVRAASGRGIATSSRSASSTPTTQRRAREWSSARSSS